MNVPFDILNLAVKYPDNMRFISAAWVMGYQPNVIVVFLRDTSIYGIRRREVTIEDATYTGQLDNAVRALQEGLRDHVRRDDHGPNRAQDRAGGGGPLRVRRHQKTEH